MIDYHETFLNTPDGFRLSVRLVIPPSKKAVVVMCHGITTNSAESGFFVDFEQLLIESSIACTRFDFRGHGTSSGTPNDVSLRGELLDLRTVRAWLDSLVDAPVFYLVASFGASAAVHDAHSSECAGLILINPILDYAGVFLRGESSWGKEIVSSYNDTEYQKDDPIGRLPRSEYVITAQLLRDVASDTTFELLRTTAIPTLVFHGAADALVPVEPVRALQRHNPSIDLVIYEHGRHGLKEFRPDLMARTRRWILDHVEHPSHRHHR